MESFWQKIAPALIVLLLVSLGFNLLQYKNVQNSKAGMLIMEVLDGDTVLLENKVRLRLRHTDVPELNYCLGQESKNYLEKLVKGKRVEVFEQIIDQQGRPMALLSLNGKSVNEEMLKLGFARYHSDKTSLTEVLKAAADEAKNLQKGIYSSECYQKDPPNPKCVIKGNIDKNTYDASAKKYYLPNCAQYKFTVIEKDTGENWFCTEEEAKKAGFTKAQTCN